MVTEIIKIFLFRFLLAPILIPVGNGLLQLWRLVQPIQHTSVDVGGVNYCTGCGSIFLGPICPRNSGV